MLDDLQIGDLADRELFPDTTEDVCEDEIHLNRSFLCCRYPNHEGNHLDFWEDEYWDKATDSIKRIPSGKVMIAAVWDSSAHFPDKV